MNFGDAKIPLADRMRPKMLADFIGQDNVLGKDRILSQAIEADNIPSMVFGGLRVRAKQRLLP